MYHYPLKGDYFRLSALAVMLRKVNFNHGTRDGKHDNITSRDEAKRQTFP